MKILIDINHPAHVHYFHAFIKQMEVKGHSFVVTNRDDKLINHLLDAFEISHFTRNKRHDNSKGFLTSLMYLFKMLLYVLSKGWKHNTDAFLGFSSSACAISAFLLRKPCVVFDDTEHNEKNRMIYKRFVSLILTPFFFKKQIRKDQVYFDAFMEQLYLSKVTIKRIINKPYIFMRFSSFDASHDSKVDTSLIEIQRETIIDLFQDTYEIIISAEGKALSEKYEKFKGNYNFEDVHHVMRNADFIISDGATTASEAGIIGVPYVYTNPLFVGYLVEQEKSFNNVYLMDYPALIIRLEQDLTFFKTNECKTENKMSYINPTELLVWLFGDLKNRMVRIRGQRITNDFYEKLLMEH